MAVARFRVGGPALAASVQQHAYARQGMYFVCTDFLLGGIITATVLIAPLLLLGAAIAAAALPGDP